MLDSGVRHSHPDIQPNIWHNPDEINDNEKDDDHNGYVDDYYGVNVRKGSGSGGDADGHGPATWPASSAAAATTPPACRAYWTAKIMSVRFMDDHGHDLDRTLADFNNFGSTSVDLAAPGGGVYSTYPTSTYRYLDGTSMAASPSRRRGDAARQGP